MARLRVGARERHRDAGKKRVGLIEHDAGEPGVALPCEGRNRERERREHDGRRRLRRPRDRTSIETMIQHGADSPFER